jgi:dihydroorotase-like cyclic amidohydrolase
VKKLGPYAKVNPRFGRNHVNALWEGINDGTTDVITSDPPPQILTNKKVGWQGARRACMGCSNQLTMCSFGRYKHASLFRKKLEKEKNGHISFQTL